MPTESQHARAGLEAAILENPLNARAWMELNDHCRDYDDLPTSRRLRASSSVFLAANMLRLHEQIGELFCMAGVRTPKIVEVREEDSMYVVLRGKPQNVRSRLTGDLTVRRKVWQTGVGVVTECDASVPSAALDDRVRLRTRHDRDDEETDTFIQHITLLENDEDLWELEQTVDESGQSIDSTNMDCTLAQRLATVVLLHQVHERIRGRIKRLGELHPRRRRRSA